MKSRTWIGHIPFAFEVINALEPRVVVELGVYSGTSLAAFCQAVRTLGLNTKCYGIDDWQGDVHTGKIHGDIYNEVRDYFNDQYPDISILIREKFNKAVERFSDREVDLLHIDGMHTFEAISNDYTKWLPKMSDKGIILFHDINVSYMNFGFISHCGFKRIDNFGVKNFFDSIKEQYHFIEFTHSYGLGCLFVGKNKPVRIRQMIEDSKFPEFQAYFAGIGNKLIFSFCLNKLLGKC